MVEVITAFFLLGGSFFMLVTAVGLLRLPDVYLRMHAITKAGTLGVGLVMTGVAISFGELGVVTRTLAVIGFVLLTAPVSAHMIGRAAYLGDSELWQGTLLDELQGMYDRLEEEVGEGAPEADAAAPNNHPQESGY